MPRASRTEVDGFYAALSRLLRRYQFRDRDRQTICGISVTQCYALEFLVQEGRLSVFELGQRLALDKSNASRVVQALERAGAASRTADPANHRVRWIEATPRGRALHARITGRLKRGYARILSPLPRSSVRAFTGVLEALAEAVRPDRPKSSSGTRKSRAATPE